MTYDMPFREWLTSAKVRGPVPAQAADGPDWTEGILFTPELVPCISHPLVRKRGPGATRWLLAQALYANLEFTQVLEHQVVNNAVYAIARDQSGFGLPAEMVADAWNILVDESYHGKMTADLARLAQARTGVANRASRIPAFYQRLQRELARADAAIKPVLPLFFCSISETLITKTLIEIPKDPRVPQAIRRVMRDHAEDESKHHRFFASFIAHAWPQLTERFRQRIGPLLPRFMAIFIDADVVAVRRNLSDVGLSEAEADEVLEDCYSEECLCEARRNSASASLHTLHRLGVTRSQHVRDELARFGLADIPELAAA